jgi:hypothetical protein
MYCMALDWKVAVCIYVSGLGVDNSVDFASNFHRRTAHSSVLMGENNMIAHKQKDKFPLLFSVIFLEKTPCDSLAIVTGSRKRDLNPGSRMRSMQEQGILWFLSQGLSIQRAVESVTIVTHWNPGWRQLACHPRPSPMISAPGAIVSLICTIKIFLLILNSFPWIPKMEPSRITFLSYILANRGAGIATWESATESHFWTRTSAQLFMDPVQWVQ